MKDQPLTWLAARKDVIRIAPFETRIETSGRVTIDLEELASGVAQLQCNAIRHVGLPRDQPGADAVL